MSLEETIKQQMQQQARSVIDSAYAKLAPEANKTTFPLNLFDQYFAPFFFNGKPLSQDSDIFATWVGIAGSPMASVDIIDDKGKIVFTVPPLYNTGMIGFLRDNDFSKVMDEYQLYSNALPSVAMGFVENKLLPKADASIETSDKQHQVAQWADIAARYTKRPTEANKAINTNNNISNNSDDDLSYDV